VVASALARLARRFFFEKKHQKTFVRFGFALPGRLSPDSQKFLGSFFQKRPCLLA
jgi:hypothetical protein